ncbi:TonB-dependent receptor [Thalassotalea crassostreae]|uniref:TonB-dependent receptor n=1 Tax=Thalassotalea crassostreae TaxID=1763536 RepID=UPI00083985FB|nr:TonB-dependent receptor [Thalassotalea crassostreae]
MKKVTFNRSTIATAVSTAILLSVPSAAYAEEAQASATEDKKIERIQVTATHRSVSQEELPFNISSVQGEEIEGLAIVDNAELLRNVAGITVVDRGQRNGGTTNSMIIRGLNVESGTPDDVGESTVPTVSTYVDSTPIFANFLLKDIERVEILRGPQGTLYGSGSLGGTVRYIMNKPDADLTEGSFKLDLSQTDGSDGQNLGFDAMYNMPVGETSALRFVMSHVDQDGIIDAPNLYQLDDNGIPLVKDDAGNCKSVSDGSLTSQQVTFNGACYESKDDIDSVEMTYFKVAFATELTDDINLLITHHIQSDEVGGRRAVTNGADYYGNEYGEYENGLTALEPSERDVSLTSLEIEADLGFATLTSSSSVYDHDGSGWRDNTSLWVTDRTGGAGFTNWFDILYTGNPRPLAHVEAGFEDEAIIQEFRLVSNTDESDSIDWIVGAYYMDQERTTTNFSHLRGLEEYGFACIDVGASCASDGSWWAGVDAINDMDFSYIRKETFEDMALYGELTYKFSKQFRVTAGVRWFDNELTNETSTFFAFLQPEDIPFVEYPTQSEDDILMKLNISYDISDQTMLYATYSEGFRRGGSNAIPDSGPFAEYRPETVSLYEKDTVENYEIGIKGYTDNITYSADIFMVDWDQPQLNTSTAWWAFFMAQNGESAESSGVELEMNAQLSSSLNLNIGYAFVESELSDDLIAPQYENVIAESGARLPGVAEHTFSMSLKHMTNLTDEVEMVSRISGYYQSDSVNSVVESSSIYDEFDGFTIFNASVTFVMDNWATSLYMKNISNEEGVTASYPDSYLSTDTGVFENYYGNNQRDYIARPRTIGATLSYQF